MSNPPTFDLKAFFKLLDGRVFDTAKELRELCDACRVDHIDELPPDYTAYDMGYTARTHKWLRDNDKGQLYVIMKPQPGDRFAVKVGGVYYDTIIDEHGTQRFIADPVIKALCDGNDQKVGKPTLDLNYLAMLYRSDKPPFTQREYAEFNMKLGYSVCGFAELSSFTDMPIENPLWD